LFLSSVGIWEKRMKERASRQRREGEGEAEEE
jgi:hypothetical protein